MGLRRRYHTKTDAPRRHSSYSSTSGELLDEIGMTEAVRAASAAVTALADALNALGLRIALAKEVYSTPEGTYPSYHNRLHSWWNQRHGKSRGFRNCCERSS
jgi:hypothetical protein